MGERRPGRALALGQGVFFVATGLWPIVHLPSFEAITGPKPEGWLVKTVGALLVATGGALALASRRPLTREWAVLGAGSAAALAAVDVWYAGVRRRIAPVYLLDAPLELAFVAAWAAAWRRLEGGAARRPVAVPRPAVVG
jgi:hypothetical protein